MKSTIVFRYASLLLLQCLILNNSFTQSTSKVVFNYTGSDQTFTVPQDVTKITVKAWGAGGAGGNYPLYDLNDIGGGGGYVTGTLNITPGEHLTIVVGGGGEPGAGSGAYGGGGGKDCGEGGRGGGRSAIISSSGDEIITAGAGGGGGAVGSSIHIGGHGGGGLTGQPDNWLPYGGGAGTQTTWGAGGKNSDWPDRDSDGLPGGLHYGGDAPCYDNGYNGSGGSGYYGGGSGSDIADGAGGGGSSFVPKGGNTISATNDIPANISDPDYKDSAGYGGQKGDSGKPGLVCIILHHVFDCGSKLPNIKIFDVTTYESDSVVALLVQVSEKLNLPITLNYATVDSTAIGGKKVKEKKDPFDYIITHGKVTIPAGKQTALILVKIVKDNITEPTEFFKVFIGHHDNKSVGSAFICKGIGVVNLMDGSRPINNNPFQRNSKLKSSKAEADGNSLIVTAQPNPSTNFFTLKIQSKSQQPIMFNVVDAIGRIVETRRDKPINGILQIGNSYRTGIYYIQVIQGNEKITLKLIKQ